MATRLCYPGTNIALIRGGAPDTDPPNSPTAPPSAAPPASTPPSTAPPTTPPADDWQAKHAALEKEHAPWKQHLASFGLTPEQTRETIEWARRAAQEIQSGKLRYGDQPPTAKDTAAPPADPFDGWDDLDARQQAARLRKMISEDLQTSLKPEVESVKSLLQNFTTTQGGQLQLAMQAMRLSQESGVPFDELIASATELASLSPQQLLQQALAAKASPGRHKQEIEQAVQRALADAKAEADKERVAGLTARISPRLLPEQPKDPLERAQKRRTNLLSIIQREVANTSQRKTGSE